MAYARWCEDSQVYVYADASFGGLTCCGCVNGRTVDQMVTHLEDHIQAGHRVPANLITDILADRAFIDAYPPQTFDQLMRQLTVSGGEEL